MERSIKVDLPCILIVRWFENMAGIDRSMRLKFWQNSQDVELYDLTTRRGMFLHGLFREFCTVFLKRSEVRGLVPQDFRIGNRVTILSRLLEVVSYGDELTRVRIEGLNAGRLFLVVLPDSYDSVGQIVTDIQALSSLQLARLLMVKLTTEQASRFYNLGSDPESNRISASDLSFLTKDVITVIVFDLVPTLGCVTSHFHPQVGLDYSNNHFLHGNFGGEQKGAQVLLTRSFAIAEQHIEYFFESRVPFKKTAIMNHCALLVVKPHAFNKSGDVIQSILNEGLEISAMESRTFELAFIEEFLDGYRVAFGGSFKEICYEMASGTCLIIQVRQDDIVQKVRRLCGPMDPEQARVLDPKSLRARFGQNIIRNAVHCTDLEDDGVRDCQLMFR